MRRWEYKRTYVQSEVMHTDEYLEMMEKVGLNGWEACMLGPGRKDQDQELVVWFRRELEPRTPLYGGQCIQVPFDLADELTGCAACSSKHPQMVRYNMQPRYALMCNLCGARGPARDTKQDAVDSWAKMSKG